MPIPCLPLRRHLPCLPVTEQLFCPDISAAHLCTRGASAEAAAGGRRRGAAVPLPGADCFQGQDFAAQGGLAGGACSCARMVAAPHLPSSWPASCPALCPCIKKSSLDCFSNLLVCAMQAQEKASSSIVGIDGELVSCAMLQHDGPLTCVVRCAPAFAWQPVCMDELITHPCCSATTSPPPSR